MNKWLWIIIAILSAWLLKLSIDVYQMNTQNLSNINTILNQQVQKLGQLNDQLVALQQKQIEPQQPSNNVETKASIDVNQQYNHEKNEIYDRLHLTQLAIEQQQFNLALQYIQDLYQDLQNNAVVPESLKIALIEALTKDQAAIVLYLQQRQEHLLSLQKQLESINKALTPKPLENSDQKWDISTWFTLTRSNQTPDLAQRNLHYQQLQLQILLAKQALLAGQLDFYRQQIIDMIRQLQAYPDEVTQQNIKQLRQLEQVSLNALPHMSALALIKDK